MHLNFVGIAQGLSRIILTELPVPQSGKIVLFLMSQENKMTKSLHIHTAIVHCVLLASVLMLHVPYAAANPSLGEALQVANAGDARAQYITGMMYMFGQGTHQDIAEGAHWLERSVRAGIPQAMVALAELYDIGEGVPEDIRRASQLREQAALAGDPTARGQIADNRNLRGQADFRRASVLTDLKLFNKAVPYAKRAADAGSANAQLLLGRAYHFGNGVPVNLSLAVSLYQRSADGGLADGNRALAYMYEFGLGVRVDRKKALFYYDRSAAKGSALARQAAANLRSPDYDQAMYRQDSGDSDGTSPSSPTPSISCPYGTNPVSGVNGGIAYCQPYYGNTP